MVAISSYPGTSQLTTPTSWPWTVGLVIAVAVALVVGYGLSSLIVSNRTIGLTLFLVLAAFFAVKDIYDATSIGKVCDELEPFVRTELPESMSDSIVPALSWVRKRVRTSGYARVFTVLLSALAVVWFIIDWETSRVSLMLAFAVSVYTFVDALRLSAIGNKLRAENIEIRQWVQEQKKLQALLTLMNENDEP
jgi:hypothetical protein